MSRHILLLPSLIPSRSQRSIGNVLQSALRKIFLLRNLLTLIRITHIVELHITSLLVRIRKTKHIVLCSVIVVNNLGLQHNVELVTIQILVGNHGETILRRAPSLLHQRCAAYSLQHAISRSHTTRKNLCHPRRELGSNKVAMLVISNKYPTA